MGCPALALEVLTKLPEVEFEEEEEEERARARAKAAAATPVVHEPNEDLFSWGAIGG